jgi:DNA adenine methylase
MPGVPHPIPYQGSKRRLASAILRHFPRELEVLYEPCCGSAALSLAALHAGRVERVVMGDSFVPLIELWRRVMANPEALADEYAALWAAQHANPRAYYDHVRARFNREGGAARLLFLLTRCVKSAVRFNAQGEFNQSPDQRRLGTRPERIRTSLLGAASVLQGRTELHAGDYAALLERATERDLVYLDPPYQGTSSGADCRYHQSLDRERFVSELVKLQERAVPVIVSFDGATLFERSGGRRYGEPLPAHLGLVRFDLRAGRSSQATLNGEAAETVESLYVSQRLLQGGSRNARGAALPPARRGGRSLTPSSPSSPR